MKKFLSIILVLCMAFAVCTMTACNNKKDTSKNPYEDLEEFDSYVPDGSEIIGKWQMTSPDTDKEWQFFDNTTLHQTKHIDDISTSTVCTYNYDGEGNLKVYVFTNNTEYGYTVEIKDNVMTLTDAEGAKLTFTKM